MKILNYSWIVILLSSLFVISCKGPASIIEGEILEERLLEEIVVTPEPKIEDVVLELPTYNSSYTRKNDIVHTRLDLAFDWSKQHVLGEAWIDVKPLFYDVNELVLDAKGFDLNKVEVNGKTAKYDYEDEILTIDLGRTFTSKDKYQIYIDYTAKPNERKFGGSAAITSEKGLFFINPIGEEGNKPMQIWTQGETENNSAWFPTVDKPNERMTQEIHLKVQNKFVTLSNGLLKSSKKNSDGTRTDHWVMDMPHAPYLAMLMIGEFAVVEEEWRGKLLQYIVEPEYEKDAKAIFANTPEMLTFFSDYLGVEYPWQKYSQVIAKDYVSGAMENTTAVIFGDFVQNTTRELIDNHNDRIVAHEMMHHWFGDYVTCESWANLSMNEGFANYSEYLWLEHQYGEDAADYHLMGEQSGYMASSSQTGTHPLIHFGYEDKEEMFDAHSYNKGGAILHMLRKTIGDDAFRAALQKYLTDNKLQSVEAHNLRLAMESVSGQDLNWFFNQWYFNEGHPSLEIEYGYDATNKEAMVAISQVQNPKENPAIFVLPMAVDIYTENGKAPVRKMITMDKREQVFRFKSATEPKLIIADADHYLLANKYENRTEEDYIFQFYNAPLFYDRYSALEALSTATSAAGKKVKKDALKDKFWSIRNVALSMVKPLDNADKMSIVVEMAKSDDRSQVKAAALILLGTTGDTKYTSIAKNAVDKERSYTVVSAGLEALTQLDKESAVVYAGKLENENSGSIIAAVGKIYEESSDMAKLAFFEKNFDKMTGYGAVNFFTSYATLSSAGGVGTMMKSATSMKAIATNMSQDPWRRLAAMNATDLLFKELKNAKDTDSAMKLKQMIEEIKKAETNDQLKSMYGRFGN
ncbi:MAG: aminopeptidase N [Maribacter sp.]|jgi:aminopeptidase N